MEHRGSSPAPVQAAAYLDSAPVAAGVIQRIAFIAGQADVWMASVPRRPRWVAVRPSRPAGLARLVRPPPDGRCARHTTARSGAARCGDDGRARRRSGPTVQGSAAMPPIAGRAHARRVHNARRVDRDAGSLAQRGAMRRASHSRGCGGLIGVQDGRHDRRNRKSSLRKLPARRERSGPSVARRASRGVEDPAARSARRRLKHTKQPSAVSATHARAGLPRRR